MNHPRNINMIVLGGGHWAELWLRSMPIRRLFLFSSKRHINYNIIILAIVRGTDDDRFDNEKNKCLTMLIMGKNNPVKATAAVVALDGPPQNIVLIFSVCYAYASRPSLPLYMLSSSVSLSRICYYNLVHFIVVDSFAGFTRPISLIYTF